VIPPSMFNGNRLVTPVVSDSPFRKPLGNTSRDPVF
jgi:hypothetical protein